jgi:site-specific recombinase XerD
VPLGNYLLHHTFGSMAVSDVASIFDVQKLLGRENIEISQGCSHLSDVGLKKATADVTNMLAQAA